MKCLVRGLHSLFFASGIIMRLAAYTNSVFEPCLTRNFCVFGNIILFWHGVKGKWLVGIFLRLKLKDN